MTLYERPAPIEGVVIIALEGEFDLDGTVEFLQRCEALAASGVSRLVIDMVGVEFMDSSGINALLRVHHLLNAAGGWIRLAGVRQPADTVIALVGLDQVIPIHPDTDSVLHAV